MLCRFAGVSMIDGAIAFTQMPRGASSSASASVSPATALLVAA